MRATSLFALFILGCAGFILAPAISTGQPGGGKKKGGGGPGGYSMMSQDPNTLFDVFAKGRSFFLIAETRGLRDPLTQFAQEKGITNGQITRNQFVEYMNQAKAKMASSMASARKKGAATKGFPPASRQGLCSATRPSISWPMPTSSSATRTATASSAPKKFPSS